MTPFYFVDLRLHLATQIKASPANFFQMFANLYIAGEDPMYFLKKLAK
jgi:hypothetical protein